MLFVVAATAAPAAYRGLNLPSQHADTNQGNFLPGVFAYKSYSIDRIRAANFTALRLGINVETARDRATLKTLRGYVDALGTAAEPGILICMWDTLRPNETGHGDGLVNDVAEMTEAWRDAARDFVGFVESRSISKLYFWRADIDDEGECTAPYYFDVARRWLAGGTHF